MSTGNAFYQRHFLRLMDFTPAELQALLNGGRSEAGPRSGAEQRRL
ncbi:hypothetical protein M8494_25625 [Serratia ureilytica]